MAKKIHYDDNLFYVREIIKSTKNGYTVEIDNTFFSDKIIEDIFFIDATIRRITTTIYNQDQMINRDEILRSLTVTASMFAELLEEILDKESTPQFFQKPFIGKFQEIKTDLSIEQTKIKKLLSGSKMPVSTEDLVSREEFNLLLHDKDL